MISVSEEAPELAPVSPRRDWDHETDPERIAQLLTESAGRVREAVERRIESDRDHPQGHCAGAAEYPGSRRRARHRPTARISTSICFACGSADTGNAVRAGLCGLIPGRLKNRE